MNYRKVILTACALILTGCCARGVGGSDPNRSCELARVYPRGNVDIRIDGVPIGRHVEAVDLAPGTHTIAVNSGACQKLECGDVGGTPFAVAACRKYDVHSWSEGRRLQVIDMTTGMDILRNTNSPGLVHHE
jgi:hypothetical protein